MGYRQIHKREINTSNMLSGFIYLFLIQDCNIYMI